MSFDIRHGDCREVMQTLHPESVDSIVSDPPYGLSFMGKGWDHGVPGEEFWTEALRVAKPGAHLLAFGGTRTYHRLACAIEDAGWEIRDCVMWVYGSGFPKSHDVSKAIDKRGGGSSLTTEIGAAIKAARISRGVSVTEADRLYCGGSTLWTWYEGRPAGQQLPTPVVMAAIVRDWPELAVYAEAIAEADREKIGERDGSLLAVAPGQDNDRSSSVLDITAPATDAARRWSGWGTALKPAWEPIIVARKPLCGTVAENVLKHGTGGINVDGCRVAFASEADERESKDKNAHAKFGTQPGGNDVYGDYSMVTPTNYNPPGRWPANFIHDGSDEVVGLFPHCNGKIGMVGNTGGNNRIYGKLGRQEDRQPGTTDTGSAARFFYCAKANKKDRSEGNSHPTVKPTDLMRYLCRLVTPPGGVVLDPFTGSGSTGKAAVLEGFRFIGIEREAEYVEIAKARIGTVEAGAGPLFAG
jgi:DNA modification methylase